jgi:threonyl-tRNA synthetase
MDKKELEISRHSCSHILAAAVQKLYPQAKFGVGPVIENGFYYDIDLPGVSLSIEDLAKIEKEMQKIIAADVKFEKKEMPIAEALTLFQNLDQPYKVELLQDLKTKGTTAIDGAEDPWQADQPVTIYQTGDFVDLCRGPHVQSSQKIKAFKLQKVSGAYWRGDESRPMLTRIYGLAFATQTELDEYLRLLTEAEKRDHRKLGKELELFMTDQMVGLGLIMWLPKGARLWRIMEDFWYQEHLKNGYELVRTPHIGSRALWETSGHWGFYSDTMYPPLEVGQSLKEKQEGKEAAIKEEYLLKPMNCPFHVVMYNSKPHSYRDLPVRWAESATVYRYEKSGQISGLTRVRGFTQDDAHIICTPEQAEEELKRVLDFIIFIFKSFGFEDYKIYLSLRDPENKKKYAGNDEGWEFTEKVLEKVAQDKKLDYTKEIGEAAFYGPKLDFKVKDALGREWQCSTLQYDFNLPEKFDLTYIDKDGQKKRPYMLHRALFGSFERFIGVLLEHYTGALPVWLSPVQISLLPVGETHKEYCHQLADKFTNEGFRVEVDDANETIGNKIRKATGQKIPYLLVIGDREMSSDKLSIRCRGQEQLLELTENDFSQRVKEEMNERRDH